MVWAGSPFAQRIEFSTGLPTGAISYQLLGNDGSVLVDDSITPDAGAISALIVIPGAQNSCATPLFETRELTWNYLTADGLVSDRVIYRVDKPIPFAASPAGVRSKLGIEPHELRDDEVDLISAYAELLTWGDPSEFETSGDRNTLLMIHAIEALAAAAILSTIVVKIAKKETSGTNAFERYTSVDWEAIERNLAMHMARARQLIDATYDATGDTMQVLQKATPSPDIITAA